MSELIIQSKIIPPKSPTKIIQRERLIRLLNNNIDKNLILICSPAGTGKTLLVRDFLSQTNFKFAWLTASSDINNFYSFFRYTIHSLKLIDSRFGTNTLQLIDSLKETPQPLASAAKDKDKIQTIAGTFINEFCNCFRDEIIFVIDDLHNIVSANKWLNETFFCLLECIPSNLHLIILTREKPKFNLVKVQAKRNLLQLGITDMNFNEDEIYQLLSKIYSLSPSKSDIKILNDYLGGWITGIHLLLQAYGEGFNKITLKKKMLPEIIFNYFAGEILENLERITIDFLLYTSLLDNFTLDLCKHVLENKDAAEIIKELLNKSIFILETERVPERPWGDGLTTSYNYQDLFKSFLAAKLYETKSDDEINSFLNKVFNYYKEIKDIESAINIALLGRDYSSAIPLIIEQAEKLIDESEFDKCGKWITSLPPEIISGNPYLLYFKGRLKKYLLGEFEEANKNLDKAIELFEAQGDRSYLLKCFLSKIDILFIEGKNEEAAGTLEKILSTHPAREQEAYLLNYLGRAYFNMHLYDKALVLLDRALQLSREENLKKVEYRVMNLIGSINGNRGEITKGLFYFEQIIDKEVNIYRKFMLLTNIILSYSISGNYTRAREYFEQASELFKKFSGPMLEVYFLRAPVNLKFEIGDYEDAIKHLENMNRAAAKINFKSYIYFSFLHIGHSYYYLNKFSKAEQYYDLASNYIDKRDKYQQLTVKEAKALTLKTKSLSPAIEKTLLEAKKQYDEINFLIHKRHCLFHLADYYLKKQNYDKATEYLGESLELCSDKGHIAFLERELIFDKTLFDFAIVNPELISHKEFVWSIFERAVNKPNIDWLSDECKRRFSIQTDKLYHINLISFGTFEFKIGGNVIPEKLWIRKKARLILAYLLVNKKEKLTKDRLLDMFFGDLSADTAENLSHQAIANIKEVIKSSIPSQIKLFFEKGKISPYLVYKNKILQLNQDFFYKSDADEFEKLYYQVKSSETPADDKIKYAKEAIELYKGEFLPGHDVEWCRELRQKYLNIYIELCETIISLLNFQNSFDEVIFYSNKLLETDKLNTNAYLYLVDAYTKLGNIKMAKNEYNSMIKAYDKELGEKPPKIILEKINNLLAE